MNLRVKSIALALTIILGACGQHVTTVDIPAPQPVDAVAPAAVSSRGFFEAQGQLVDEAGHEFAVEVLYPDTPGSYPLILFSSGNFASPDRYRKLLGPIAQAGYVIVSPVHRDAEILALDPPAPQEEVWTTRNSEMAYLATLPAGVTAILANAGVTLEPGKLGLFGHSYGALIAQLGAGAKATGPAGERDDHTLAAADVLIAYSPPGPFPGRFDAEGWSHIAVPSLTLSGTADVFPGFLDDWRDHIVSYEATPPGERWLWVGEGVDHYFNGTFGREKPVAPEFTLLFDDAVATTIAFLNWHLKGITPPATDTIAGVTLTKDIP